MNVPKESPAHTTLNTYIKRIPGGVSTGADFGRVARYSPESDGGRIQVYSVTWRDYDVYSASTTPIFNRPTTWTTGKKLL